MAWFRARIADPDGDESGAILSEEDLQSATDKLLSMAEFRVLEISPIGDDEVPAEAVEDDPYLYRITD